MDKKQIKYIDGKTIEEWFEGEVPSTILGKYEEALNVLKQVLYIWIKHWR